MKLFALEMIMGNQFSFSLETIGIYSTQEKALKALRQLPMENENMVYNISEFEVDAPPHNAWDNSTEIKNLMDMGIIDQLVGEDGNFYYRLTEKGKEITKAKRKDPDDYDFF